VLAESEVSLFCHRLGDEDLLWECDMFGSVSSHWSVSSILSVVRDRNLWGGSSFPIFGRFTGFSPPDCSCWVFRIVVVICSSDVIDAVILNNTSFIFSVACCKSSAALRSC